MDEEDGEGYRILKDSAERFCVSRSKFAIVGREACESSAYRSVNYFATTKPEDGKLVFELFERNFDEALRGR